MSIATFRTRLRSALTANFSDGELNNLCFDLGLDYEGLPGDSKMDKARELILYFERRNDVATLVAAVTSSRPDIVLEAPAAAPITNNAAADAPPNYPYPEFLGSFREIIAPVRYEGPETVLNIVFGNIADLRRSDVVIPINQSFDFSDRGPRGVLEAFSHVTIGQGRFFDELERLWPTNERPKSAGIGHTQHIMLPANSQEIGSVYFVVTTRNMTNTDTTRGRYIDTPIEGIDYILNTLIDCAEEHGTLCLALPLLGAGHANAGRTRLDPYLTLPLRRAVLGLTIQKLEDALTHTDGTLKRGVIVIHSSQPQSQEEHDLWSFVIRFITMGRVERTHHISALIAEFERLSRA